MLLRHRFTELAEMYEDEFRDKKIIVKEFNSNKKVYTGTARKLLKKF